jgi:hypothetical protein
MGGEWRAWALPDVSEESLRGALAAQGLVWGACLHVAATGSLAKEMRRAGVPALSIATLLDVVVWAGMPADQAMAIEKCPSLTLVVGGEQEVFETALKTWSNEVAGRTLSLGIRADLRLRRFLDHDAPDIAAARVLRRSVRDVRRAVQSIATAGFEPDDFDDTSAVPSVALEAWRRLSTEVPELFRLRDDVWTDPATFATGATPQATQLRQRIDVTLERLLGGSVDHRTIVYHGFYFFTPHQWAWFQLLRHHGGIDQHFIVHDDCVGRAFETWRRYFVDRWGMPRPLPVAGTAAPSRASVLASALAGDTVPTSTPDRVTNLVRCETSTEFIDLWRSQRRAARDRGAKMPLLFAAGTGDIERLIRRLDFDSAQGEVDLAELPIGQFLLALHGCVETLPGGSHRLVLDRSKLIDMVASRLLDTEDGERSPSHHVAAFERAMPFFDDCTVLSEWVDRAKVLERLVISEVSALGRRMEGLTDCQRISVAVSNPLRLVPWADLSDLEVTVIWETIVRVAELTERVTSAEDRDPNQYLGWIRQQLARGMANLPPEERMAVEEKLRGISAGGVGEFDVEGIIDVVHMLLGRQAEFGFDGNSESDSPAARELRNLDALGFAPSTRDVHVANLVDTEFPAKYQSFRWPFDERLLKPGAQTSQVSVEIFRTREETAALSDLYLFWLALCGVSSSSTLTLSWITGLGTEIRSPSSLVTLISSLDHSAKVLANVVGGLEVKQADQILALPHDRTIPALRPSESTDAELATAIARLDPIAASSVLVCPRRFALQWAMGPSGAFQTPHTQRMLFGNVQGALEKPTAWGWSADAARRLTKDLWRQLTRGERMSSYVKRVVNTGPSADWKWIFTLQGNRSGTDPASAAYQAALSGDLPTPDAIAPAAVVLPVPDVAKVGEKVCNMCPVKPRCSMQVSVRDQS